MRATRRRRREWYWDGFRDALLRGHPNPFSMADSHKVAYDKGFDDGARTVKRLIRISSTGEGAGAGK